MNDVCVYGLWHLGSVTAAGMSVLGFQVEATDPDANVVKALSSGVPPIFEPNLGETLQQQIKSGRLLFNPDVKTALSRSAIVWVTFDTPVDDRDIADVNYVVERVFDVMKVCGDDTTILISSQLPVGTLKTLEASARALFSGKKIKFACVPENLRLGNALEVFLKPDRIVVGIRTNDQRQKLSNVFERFETEIVWMSIESAEMTKHAINSFLAASVAFANELASISGLAGADIDEVEKGLKTDVRIGSRAYLRSGSAFSGGTLARDIRFLNDFSSNHGLQLHLLKAIEESNDIHKNWYKHKISDLFSDLNGIKIVIWGLAYKAGTNTLRRSLAVELGDWLLEKKAELGVFDPIITELPLNWIGNVRALTHPLDWVSECNLLIVTGDWPTLLQDVRNLEHSICRGAYVLDADRKLQTIRQPLIEKGVRYFSVGIKEQS